MESLPLQRAPQKAATAPRDSTASPASSQRVADDGWTREQVLEAANSGLTFLSVIIALVAVRLTLKALRLQAEAPDRERRAGTYHAVMVVPALEILPRFERNVIDAMDKGVRDLQAIEAAGGSVADAKKRRRALVDQFNAAYWSASNRLLGAAHAWGDEALLGDLEVVLEKIQDQMVPELAVIDAERADQLDLGFQVRESVARVTQTIIHHKITLPS